MIYEMNLEHYPFEQIRKKLKTIELRLCYEDRKQMKSDDYILFTNQVNKKKMIVKVLHVHKFADFIALYKALPLKKCGYEKSEVNHANPMDMNIYYSKEKQEQYGVMGIEIELFDIENLIEITDMTKAYEKQKGEVHYQAWIDTYTGIMNQAFLDKMTLSKCIDIAEKFPQKTLVAVIDKKVVGFAAYNHSSDNILDTGEIFALYVTKAYQGLGIGKKLIKMCFLRLKEFSQISLYVLDKNQKAINWYQKQGFKQDGYIKEQKTSVDGYDLIELRMTKQHV